MNSAKRADTKRGGLTDEMLIVAEVGNVCFTVTSHESPPVTSSSESIH